MMRITVRMNKRISTNMKLTTDNYTLSVWQPGINVLSLCNVYTECTKLYKFKAAVNIQSWGNAKQRRIFLRILRQGHGKVSPFQEFGNSFFIFDNTKDLRKMLLQIKLSVDPIATTVYLRDACKLPSSLCRWASADVFQNQKTETVHANTKTKFKVVMPGYFG